jgi:integrase
MAKWIQAAPGIRYRKHATRKHGTQLDRYYTLRFSVAGKQVEEALGWASEGWTVKRAQEELGRLHKAKRTGQGPVTLREEAEANRRAAEQKAEAEAALARQERTVRDLWERYLVEVVAVENKRRTILHKTRLWRQRIEPAIGQLKVGDVTEQDVGAIVRAPLRLDANGQVFAGKAAAGDLYRLLHHLFKKSLVWRLRSKELGNPLENVTEPKVSRRERLLTGSEIGSLMRTLDAAADEGAEHPQIVAVIRAAVLTGARISELLNLRWQDVRRAELELHLPDTKTGFSRRPISVEALAVLDSVERTVGVDYIFRGVKGPTAPLSYFSTEKAFKRIASQAGIKDCSLHTLRHWAITAIANSVSNPRVGMQLSGHRSHAAYLGYVHAHRDQAHALADQLAALANGLAKAEPNVAVMTKATTAK